MMLLTCLSTAVSAAPTAAIKTSDIIAAKPITDVRAFGLSTSDSAATTNYTKLQAGLAKMGAGTYLFSDLYPISSPLTTTTSGQHFVGLGWHTGVKQTSDAAKKYGIWIKHDQCSVKNLKVTANVPTTTNGNIGIRVRNDEISPTNIYNVSIQGALIENFPYGTVANNPNVFRVSGNTFKRYIVAGVSVSAAVEFANGTGVWITDNDDYVLSPTGSQHGMYLNNALVGVWVERNRLNGSYTSCGIQCRLDNVDSNGLTISDNEIANAVNSGILVYSTDGQPTEIKALKIDGNKISGIDGSTTTSGRGVAVIMYKVDGMDISRNRIETVTGYGIHLDVKLAGWMKNAVIAGNSIRNWATENPANAGIFNYSAEVTENVLIAFNTFSYGTNKPMSVYTSFPGSDRRRGYFVVGNLNSDDTNSYATTINAATVVHIGNSWNRREAWATSDPTAGTWTSGDVVWNTAPVAAGKLGRVCVTSGTYGSLSGVTGSITSGTAVLTVNDASALVIGQYINIVGVTGAKRIKSIDGTSVTLTSNAAETVSGAAVTYQTPAFKQWGLIDA